MATNALTTPVKKLQPHIDVLPGLHTPGLLARRPVIGWIMFIFGSLAFAGLTINLLAQGPLLAWDRMLADTLPAIGLKSPVIVKDLMIAGFHIGREVIIGLGILLGFFFIYKRYWQELTMVTIGLIGAELLFLSLSTLLARQRPPTQIWNILTIPGFPSGHGISSVTFYGLLAYLLVPKMRSAFWKGAVVVAALFTIRDDIHSGSELRFNGQPHSVIRRSLEFGFRQTSFQMIVNSLQHPSRTRPTADAHDGQRSDLGNRHRTRE